MAGILETSDLNSPIRPATATHSREAPSWRPDIEGKADLVEEIVRIAGLDRVVSRPFPRESADVAGPRSPRCKNGSKPPSAHLPQPASLRR